MTRKAIQYFRYSQAHESIRDVKLSSLVMAHEDAKRICGEIELWTDEEGMNILGTLPVSWSSVRMLPASKDVNVADMATIMLAQDCPFILLKEYVFVAMPLNEEKVSSDVFAYSLTKDAGTEYVFDTNIRKLVDGSVVRADIPDWQTERGINAAICGGHNHSFWNEYGSFVQKFLSTNPGMFELQPANFQYLVDSWLLKAFAREKEIVIEVLEREVRRIPDVRSPARLLRSNMRQPVVVVPPAVLSFIDIQEFILSFFQVRHPAPWEEFHAPKQSRNRAVHYDPSFNKDLADDGMHYERRRARLLHEVSKNNHVEHSRLDLSLEEFRQSDDLIIMTSKLTDVVKTQWNWRHGIRTEELGKLKWLANTVTPAANHITLMSAKSASLDVVENDIDDLNEVILGAFTVPILLRDGIEKIKEDFDESDPNKLFEVITLRMYDLYMLGALYVTHNE